MDELRPSRDIAMPSKPAWHGHRLSGKCTSIWGSTEVVSCCILEEDIYSAAFLCGEIDLVPGWAITSSCEHLELSRRTPSKRSSISGLHRSLITSINSQSCLHEHIVHQIHLCRTTNTKIIASSCTTQQLTGKAHWSLRRNELPYQ